MANIFDTPVLVLLYHRVTELDSDPYCLAVTRDNFRAQMAYLKDNFSILRFEEDWDNVSTPSVVVTFDDGYADNLLEALPVLEETEVPATFFVVTDQISTGNEFWWDELEFIIFRQSRLPSYFELKDSEYKRKWVISSDCELQTLHRDMLTLMKLIAPKRRTEWINQLRQWSDSDKVTRESHRAMTLDELRSFASNPLVSIGSHGVTHAALSALTPMQQKAELETSKMQLESWLEQEVSVYAYPYGDKAAYTRESARLCREAGFSKAAANFPGQAHRWTDPYQIPRHMIYNITVDIFAREIAKFWTR